MVSDLTFFAGSASIRQLPAWDTLPFESVSPQNILSAQRLRTLSDVGNNQPAITVIAADALAQRVLPRSVIDKLRFRIEAGAVIARDTLIQELDSCGFRRVSLVEEIGEIAVRGGVVDFFPSTVDQPVRVEFLDNTIETIKLFDAGSQRSTNSLSDLEVLPVGEFVSFHGDPHFEALLDSALEKIKRRGKELETPPREIARILSMLKSGTQFAGMELTNAIALEPLSSWFDYLPKSGLVIINDEIGIQQTLDSFWDLVCEREARLASEHYLIPARTTLYLSPEEVLSKLKDQKLFYVDDLDILSNDRPNIETIQVRSLPNTELVTKLKTKVGTGKALDPLAKAVAHWRQHNFYIAFVVGSQSRAERLQTLLEDCDIETEISSNSGAQWTASTHRSPITILQGHLSSGVQLLNEKLVFISESEIFSERSYRKASQATTNLKRILSSLAQLKENDFIVHVDYGIGVYRGLKHLNVNGVGADLLHIEYADSRLYLPIQNIGKIQKFVGGDGKEPILDKLSSNRWQKTRQKVRDSVVALAGDLIKLYASRSVAQGWRFEPAGAEDDRFADGFPYNETPDQLKAIDDVLADMAKDGPMDRLVCGDVGFGKTEVALRAAFKCVQHTRQVAVLVPTTILVEQHYLNFSNRFMGYPVNVKAISRFYSAADNRATLEGLANGEIDIVIGTQKLLQKDVQFKDLGLLIVDEEHRFGVKQKERLKQMKRQVDVLTLTATPIPRTLHMSLLGIRDISVISTPPQDRRIIRTYIAAHNEVLIRDAILRELQRAGQCFFVHNRIEGIELITEELQRFVPEAKFRFAHGQMDEHQLENIMQSFMNREIDVLVSTSIIESGLDIPNANTIIVNRADMFGLAQLYQLRGRVGRSDRQAYAYFLIPDTRKMGADAQKRLKVLQSLDDLGLGFNLAIRDMEIRGAGNLLGKEQSGDVLAVGFDLYSKILKETVLNLKGEELSLEESIDPEVKLGINAYIPDFYIPDISERLVLYQRLASLETPEDADSLSDEIRDRFGNFGSEVDNLIELMRLRSLLRIYGVERAEFLRSKLVLSFSPRAAISPEKVIALVQRAPTRYRFGKTHALTVLYDKDHLENVTEIYGDIRVILEQVGTISN